MTSAGLAVPRQFLSTLSLRRATSADGRLRQCAGYFYPRSPCGERHIYAHPVSVTSNFYPRSPCGERLNCSRNGLAMRYFYPRSPCGERRSCTAHNHRSRKISIHALLAESDHGPRRQWTLWRISIHALLAESDCPDTGKGLWPSRFLSTLSLRRATMDGTDDITETLFLSTLSLRRATVLSLPFRAVWIISIHALLAESD